MGRWFLPTLLHPVPNGMDRPTISFSLKQAKEWWCGSFALLPAFLQQWLEWCEDGGSTLCLWCSLRKLVCFHESAY